MLIIFKFWKFNYIDFIFYPFFGITLFKQFITGAHNSLSLG